MRAERDGRPVTTGTSRASRRLLVAYLACGLVSRVADANPHDDYWHVPWVVACFVLPVWFLSGRARDPWLRLPWLMLAIQAALSYVPFLLLFGPQWVGGVDGLLAALVLLIVPGRVRWVGLALLTVAEFAAWSVVGFPYQPVANAAVWVLVAYLNVALGLYGLASTTTLLERLESTAELLADAAVDRQRLATAERLQSSIIHRLEDVRQRAVRALSATAGSARNELEEMGRTARDAALAARQLASSLPESPPPVPETIPVSPASAYRVVSAVTMLFALQFLANTLVPVAGGGQAGPVTDVVAILVAAVMVALQLRHTRFRGGRPPRWWGLTLGLQVALCGLLYPTFGVVSMLFLPFVAGSALLLIAHPIRWLIFAAAVAVLPLLTALQPGDLQPSYQALWSVYASATEAAAALLIYGCGRFADAATALADARSRIAESAATRERLRIARDAHDTLGLALSTIALKSDLAQALAAQDATHAHREVVQAMLLAHAAVADASSIIDGTLELDLRTEIRTARDALAAAGILVTGDDEAGELPSELGTQLAAILREAVANVLRHSEATQCSLSFRRHGPDVVVEVSNDRARDRGRSESAGQGLANIRGRVAAHGGDVAVDRAGGRFTLTVRMPLEVAADRVAPS
jgi:two-component system sensor histidine kinase DesK